MRQGDDMKKIGIVGGGIMAAGMVENFIKTGYEVILWNRTRASIERLIKLGALWAESPRLVAEQTDIIIECVSDDTASRSVWLGTHGILEGARKSAVLIASSSLSLDWIHELSVLCKKQQLAFLDMPLTGSRAGAEGGSLRLLVGGDESVLESIRSELAAISSHIFYFGPSGSGMKFKLLLNSLIAIHTNAAAQSYILAEKLGLSISSVKTALFDGAMGPSSPSTKGVFENANKPAEEVNFALQWLEKDLKYAQKMTQGAGFTFDLLDDTLLDFSRANAAGLGTQDQVKIIDIFR
jgi:3-hydroxyisobutyrate dehydrogenase-like beta-hydroxyacid dehydrogenase